jgi:hypothetical protein
VREVREMLPRHAAAEGRNSSPGPAFRHGPRATGRYRPRVSTRMLLVLAAITGFAILAAFAVQVMIAT